jgi:Ca2+-binding EF-hand superfamily protein
MTKETANRLARLWANILKAEQIMEEAKTRMLRCKVNLQDVYGTIDKKGVGKVDQAMMNDFLRKCGVVGYNELEVRSLMNRFERKEEGIISYYDFIDEMLPRISQ